MRIKPRLGDRSGFPSLAADVYLSHAAISPPSVWVRAAVDAVLRDYAHHGLGAWLSWRDQRERLRGKLARRVGGSPEGVALVANTTSAVQAVAQGFPWKRGDRVVLFEGEFPTNITPWQCAAEAHDLVLEWRPLTPFLDDPSTALESFVDEQSHQPPRLVAVSWVQFQTGLRMPVEALGKACRSWGSRLFVDAIQGVGVVPSSHLMSSCDYLACGAHKWLMGVEGAGFLAVADHCRTELVPPTAGWLSHEDGVGFLFDGSGHLRYDRPVRDGPDALEGGAANALGFAALEASLDALETLGEDAVYRHVSTYLERLNEGLLARGFRSLRAQDVAARSGILAVHAPAPHDTLMLRQALEEEGVACTAPDGNLRLAPHWPNGLEEVEQVLGAVDRALDRL